MGYFGGRLELYLMGAAAMETSKMWRSKATSHLFVMFYITVLLLFSQLQLAHSSRTMSPKNVDPLQTEVMVVPSTKQEVEADFLSWVASVGKRSTSSPTPITRLPSGVKAVPPVYYVDVAGFGNFKTVQEAVNAVPDGNSMRTLIVVKPGTYRYIKLFSKCTFQYHYQFLLKSYKKIQ
jgi:pectin methylesterase-like acyl-CoA thioesterase